MWCHLLLCFTPFTDQPPNRLWLCKRHYVFHKLLLCTCLPLTRHTCFLDRTNCLVPPALSFVSFTPSPSDVRRRKRAKTVSLLFLLLFLVTRRLLSFQCFPGDTWPIKVSRQTERILLLILFTENLFVFVQVYARATHHANENKTPPGGGATPIWKGRGCSPSRLVVKISGFGLT